MQAKFYFNVMSQPKVVLEEPDSYQNNRNIIPLSFPKLGFKPRTLTSGPVSEEGYPVLGLTITLDNLYEESLESRYG